jgi:RHS repeat-associated protein
VKLTRANAAASLIPQAVTNTAFDAANEQTRFNSPTQNLTYDNNGNLTSFTDASGTTTYSWNARNQLTAMSDPSLSASFVYDGLGRRTSKTVNSTTTGFWYDGDDVLAELSGSTPIATYIRSLSIDEPFIRKQSGGDEFYQIDALGTTLALTDGAGSSNTTYTYEAFGKTAKTGASTNSFQFTGRENDGTGLYYYRARYYSPQMQRFMSEDPLEFRSGDINAYAYVRNVPTSLSDPSGKLALLGAAFGGGIDLASQLYTNGGNFRQVDWVSVVGNATSGAMGAGLASALTESFTRQLIFNSVGSADIGAVVKMAQNYSKGKCLTSNVGTSALINGFFGGLGYGIGTSMDSWIRSRAWDAATLEERLLAVSNAIAPAPRLTSEILGIANAFGTFVGNLSPMVEPLSD